MLSLRLFLLGTLLFWQTPVFAATPERIPQLEQRTVSAARRKVIMSKWHERNGRRTAIARQQNSTSFKVGEIIDKITRRIDLPLPPSARELLRRRSSSSSSSSSSVAPQPKPLPPSVPVSDAVKNIRSTILKLVNDIRKDLNLQPLKENPFLDASAQLYAIDMAKNKFFSHTDLNGGSSTDRIRAANYLTSPCDCDWTYWVGENLGMGQKTAEDVVSAWMDSPGHRANIVHADYLEIGIGYHDGYWVQHFGQVKVD